MKNENDRVSRKIQTSTHFINNSLILTFLIIVFVFFGEYAAAYFWGLALLGIIDIYTAVRVFKSQSRMQHYQKFSTTSRDGCGEMQWDSGALHFGFLEKESATRFWDRHIAYW